MENHTESPTVTAARHNVAVRLADVLYAAGADTATLIGELNEVDWRLAVATAAHLEDATAQAEDRPPAWTPADGYTPSDRTRELVARLITYRARFANDHTDPFANLPGAN